MKRALSIVLPTLGRPALKRAMASIARELGPADEVLVVGDGPLPGVANAVLSAADPRLRYLETPAPTRSWGHAQRTLGIAKAGGAWLAFMDDDDLYLPGWRQAMGRAAAEGVRPVLFRMSHRGTVIWNRPEIRPGNVSSQMILFPNVPELLGTWRANPASPEGRGGDYLFIEDTAERWPAGSVSWKKEIVAQLEEHGGGR